MKDFFNGMSKGAGVIAGIILVIICCCCCCGLSKMKPDDVKEAVNSGIEEGKASAGRNVNLWAQSPTPLSDFEYEKDEDDKTIKITGYKGNSTKLWIASSYDIKGETYWIDATEGAPFIFKEVKSIIFDEGITSISPTVFNSMKNIQYIYFPSTIETFNDTSMFGEDMFSYLSSSKKLDDRLNNEELKGIYFGGSIDEWKAKTEGISSNILDFTPIFVDSKITNDENGINVDGTPDTEALQTATPNEPE